MGVFLLQPAWPRDGGSGDVIGVRPLFWDEMVMTQNQKIAILKMVPIILMAIAMGKMPYGYYTLIRWIVCPVFVFLAIHCKKQKEIPWIWVFGVLAGLYNPIVPVHLGREIWVLANVVSVVLIVISFFIKRNEEHLCKK